MSRKHAPPNGAVAPFGSNQPILALPILFHQHSAHCLSLDFLCFWKLGVKLGVIRAHSRHSHHHSRLDENRKPPPNANSTITTWVGASLSYGDLLFVLVGTNQINVKAIVQAKHLEPNRVDRIVQRLVVP